MIRQGFRKHRGNQADHPDALIGMRLFPIAAAMMVAASCTGPTSTSLSMHRALPPTAAPQVAAPSGMAVVSISLDQVTVPAGTPIQGIATVDNRTGATIAIAGGTCNGWLFIGIANERLPYTPANGLVGCAPFQVAVGESQYPITVSTSYQSCTQTPDEATYLIPACGIGTSQVMPPLPPGLYHTSVSIPGPITAANTVAVTLTSP